MARLSPGKMHYDGLVEMFKTPSPKNEKISKSSSSSKKQAASPSVSTPRASLDATPHSLYADIPDTPNGPGEMFVSPLSSNKKTNKKGASTPSMIGVKDLYGRTAAMSKTPNFVGVKSLYKSAKKGSQTTPSFIGVKNLYRKAETKSDVDLTGVKRIFASPKVKCATEEVHYEGVKRLMGSPRAKRVPTTPTGLGDLFKTPPPVSAKKTSTPVSAKKTSTPVSAKKTSTPVSAKKTPTPVSAKKTSTPVSAKKTPTPVSAKKTSTPVSAKKTAQKTKTSR